MRSFVRDRNRTAAPSTAEPALQAVIDALFDSTAVIDREGVIRATNRAWRQFADVSDGTEHTGSVGVNYLQVCAESAERGCPDAELAAGCLRAALADEAGRLCMEYECSSPTERRWFLLRAAPVDGPDGRWALVSHLDISRRHRAERVAGLVLPGADPGVAEGRGRGSLVGLPALAVLSAREREVVAHLMSGSSVSRIAERSFVSASTVRSQLSSSFRKLGVASQHELVELIRTELVEAL